MQWVYIGNVILEVQFTADALPVVVHSAVAGATELYFLNVRLLILLVVSGKNTRDVEHQSDACVAGRSGQRIGEPAVAETRSRVRAQRLPMLAFA
jgi:hypothetical protein